MDQLSGIDASFLNIETATVHGHVGSLAVFDREPALTADVVRVDGVPCAKVGREERPNPRLSPVS